MSQGRLPSFRGPRDLSLGANGSRLKPSLSKASKDADKKPKFTPNLNVQRKDSKNAAGASTSGATPKSSSGWKNAKPDGGRKSKFSKPELIQTTGTIFSEGVGSDSAAGSRKRWGGESSEREAANALEKPKIDFSAKFDKAEEEDKLKRLLRDDFIDDLKSGHLVPIQLPMVITGKVFQQEADEKVKQELDDDVIKSAKQRKSRILDSSSDEDEEPMEVKTKPEAKAEAKDLSLRDLMDHGQSELLFFQMPDHLPVGHPSSTTVDEEKKSVALNDLTDGFLGKLQWTRSGKVRLLVNDVPFDVDVGTQVGFLQELFSVDCNMSEEEKHMTNLGRVRNRVLVTPAWNDLFATNDGNEESTTETESSDED